MVSGLPRIIEFNDRYQKDLDGYRDLQLTISIEGMVCELQLNTDVMAYVKEPSYVLNGVIYAYYALGS